MATRSRKAENSSAPQLRNEYDTCECESSPSVGVTQEELENIVAKAVAAAISVVRDEFDSRLRSVEQRLSTTERRLDQLNDVRNSSDVNPAARVDVAVPISDTSAVQRINVPSGMSFSALASDLQHTGVKELPKVKKVVRPPVVGRAPNSKLKSVATVREVNIFVSRLHPSTVANELRDCVSEVVSGLPVESVDCVKLNSKFEDLYSSYHVSVRVNSVNFSTAIELLNAPESWPCGALVRRYFKLKNG